MPGRIPQSFIDELLMRVDIVDVVDERVPLKKAGRNHTACCPFHNEKTPSFTVSPDKQFYHCFGCGAHGTAIGFLMEYGHMSFPEAVEELAARVGLDVPHDGAQAGKPDMNAALYSLMADAADYFRRQLREHHAGDRARRYLDRRGLTQAVIETYGIGYAPAGWDNLITSLGAGERTRLQQLVATGLLIDKGERRYDRFRDRVMFPIRDRRGRTIGFGGRVLDDTSPKYLNSPETAIFHKGRELYGLYEARQATRRIERVLVVEGYMDVVSLAQYGISTAVATLGTATTTDHLEVLFRTAPVVVFCFDGDRAGRQAAWRALENVLPGMREGREVRFMFLPEGEDPDTLVRTRGREPFEQEIVNAVPFSTFFFDRLAEQVDIQTMDGRARLVELARPLLAKLPRGVYREMMLDELAKRARMAAAQLRPHLAAEDRRPTPRRMALRRPYKSAPSPMRTAIAMLVQRPALAKQAGPPQRFSNLSVAGIPLLVQLIELLQKNPHLTTAAIMEHWRDTQEAQSLAKLIQYPIADDNLEQEFRETLACIERTALDARFEQLRTKEQLSDDEKQEFKQILMQMRAAKARR